MAEATQEMVSMTSEVTQAARKAACQHYGYDDEKGLAYWGNVSNHRDVERLAESFAKFERETIARLTAQSGEGRSGAGEDALGAHLRTLWEAVTAGDLSTAERHNDCELVECPMCHEGSIEAADYCNIDGKALGVQFYGIGPEHGAHERLWTAVIANFPKILAALNARQSGEGEREAAEDIKRDCYATAVRDLAKMDHVSEALKGVLFDCADLLDAKDEEIAHLSCKGGRDGAIGDIATERQRQIEAEGWTPEHDDKHYGGELSRAAACYAAHASAFQRVTVDLTAYRTADPARHDYGWPWSSSWWKPSTPRRDLVKAGALIVAEIERLDRAALRATDEGSK